MVLLSLLVQAKADFSPFSLNSRLFALHSLLPSPFWNFQKHWDAAPACDRRSRSVFSCATCWSWLLSKRH